MTLQEHLIKKIDDFGGIVKLTEEMERLRVFAKEKKWYDNMIIYFNNLYTQIIDVESHAIEYHKASTDTILFLQEFNVNRNERVNKFLIDLISFKLDYVSAVRKIS